MSVLIDDWYAKCGAMAVATLMLFFGCLRYYLAHERQVSKWYRSTLLGWRRALFDFVVFVTPVLAVAGVSFVVFLAF